MQYLMLDAEHQRLILQQRLLQYETEHYQHALNASLLTASADPSDEVAEAIKDAEQSMAVIEAAHGQVRGEIDALDPASPQRA